MNGLRVVTLVFRLMRMVQRMQRQRARRGPTQRR